MLGFGLHAIESPSLTGYEANQIEGKNLIVSSKVYFANMSARTPPVSAESTL